METSILSWSSPKISEGNYLWSICTPWYRAEALTSSLKCDIFFFPSCNRSKTLDHINAHSYLLLTEAPIQQGLARQLDACSSAKPLVYLETTGKACILLQNQGLNLQNLYYWKIFWQLSENLLSLVSKISEKAYSEENLNMEIRLQQLKRMLRSEKTWESWVIY